LGMKTGEARLHEAQLLEGEGYSDQARGIYAELLESNSSASLKREVLKGLILSGVSAFNSGRYAVATEEFDTILFHDPLNLKANYALQLVYLRTGDLDKLRALAGQMDCIYSALNSPTKRPVLAWSWQNVAYGEYLAGNHQSALKWAIRFRSKFP